MSLRPLVDNAWNRRQPLWEALVASGTEVCRLFCGEGEGLPGVVVDRYGAALVLHHFEGRCPVGLADLKDFGSRWLEVTGARAIYHKEFLQNRNREVGTEPSGAWLGQTLPAEFPVREGGLTFLIRPEERFSVGLFLDQRENRRHLIDRLEGRKVLNLFAYTCGFSVYAAAAGAQVVSVDLSKRYLEWGKANFVANGLDPAAHGFFASDAFDFLRGAERRGHLFDLIVVDPPTFSRNKSGEVFTVEKDGARLAAAAWERVAPGGRLFFSNNFEGWSQDRFEGMTLPSGGTRRPLPAPPLDCSWQTEPLRAWLLKKD